MDAGERQAEQDHKSLQGILTTLWRMSGLGRGDKILRSVHRAVTRLLRPAEAAARRLILVLARRITVTLPPARIVEPAPNSTHPEGGQVPADQRPEEQRPVGFRPFALAERLPRFLNAQPRPSPIIFSGSDAEIDGTRLAHRLDALCHALDDLQAAAQRLARWQALRKRARERGVFCAIQPLRPGLPLDLRGRARRRLKKHELFDILKSTHQRAWWTGTAPPDTS